MKLTKLLLATTLASLSTFVFANGIYVQGDVGYAKLNTKIDGEKAKDNSTSYGVAVGMDTGAVRYALDYTNYGKLKHTETDPSDPTYRENTQLKAQSFGVSAIYDFADVSGFTPYAGVRVANTQVKIDEHIVVGSHVTNRHHKKSKVGAGVVAGVQYAISPNLAVDGAVEYNRLGKFNINGYEKFRDTKLDKYGVKVGVRYNF